MSAHLRYTLQLLALVGVYYIAGRVGLSWAFTHEYASSLWPPTGIAIAALLLFGMRLLPGVFVGALLVNASLGSIPIALMVALGNTLEAYVTVWLARRFADGARAFHTPRNSARFVLAAAGGTALSASVGVGTLMFAGTVAPSAAPAVWLTWWVADMLSALLLVPLFTVMRTPLARDWSRWRIGEALLISTVLFAVAGVLFAGVPTPLAGYPLAFLAGPPLLWAAYRFGPHGAVVGAFVISIVTLIGTAAGHGIFATTGPAVALALAQIFVATIMLSALLVAAVVQQQRDNAQTLAAQAGLLRAQSEASPDGHLVVSADGRMLSFNHRFAEMWRFGPEIIASGSDELALKAASAQVVDGDTFVARVKSLYAAGTEPSHEEVLFKDGRVFERHGVPIRTDDDRYLGYTWYFRDISARKHTENTLREQEERIRLLLNSMDEAMYGVDLSGRCSFINAACLRLLGFRDEAQVLGKDMHALVHARRDDGSACARSDCPLERSLRDQASVYRQEEWLWRADGNGFAIEFSAYPIRRGGTPVGAVISFTDISARKRADAALRAAEERVRRVMAAVPVTLFATDRAGALTWVEGTGMARLGIDPRDLVGQSVFALHRADTSNHDLKRALSGDTLTYSFEVEGSFFETFFAPLYDSDGTLVGTTGVSVDVTQQRRAEDELFRASKLESIGVLAGGIAHDFNNILTAIVGNLALARLYPAEPGLLKCIGESEQAALRARGLTQQLLAFSTGGKPIKKAFSFASSLATVVEFALQGANVRVQMDIAPDLWPIDGDEGQLGQVVHNLVLNAQEAMPSGGTVEVSARNVGVGTNGAGDYIEIVVRDHGVGISTPDLGKIFDPFFSTKARGSGLGLTSSYWIVKRHDGHIDVQSEPGRGTVFTVRLPRARSASALNDSVNADSVATDSGSALFVRGNGHVLFMDDDASIREFTEALLTHLGYRVESCADGDAAVAAYRTALARGERFDVVILDLTVRGGMGGTKTIAQLRALDPDVKAIVSSGYSNDPVMAAYRRFGFNACIPKPYAAESLSRVLDDVLARGVDGTVRV